MFDQSIVIAANDLMDEERFAAQSDKSFQIRYNKCSRKM